MGYSAAVIRRDNGRLAGGSTPLAVATRRVAVAVRCVGCLVSVFSAGCVRSQGMELANTPAYGRPSTCPESPAQFMQPGTSNLDPFSPDAARCSYEPPATSAPAQLRGSVQVPGPASAPALGAGVEGVRVALYPEGTSAGNLEGSTALGRARTDASGAYFLTAPIEEAGEYLLVVHGADGEPPLSVQVIRATRGSQTVPAVVVMPAQKPGRAPAPAPASSDPL